MGWRAKGKTEVALAKERAKFAIYRVCECGGGPGPPEPDRRTLEKVEKRKAATGNAAASAAPNQIDGHPRSFTFRLLRSPLRPRPLQIRSTDTLGSGSVS